MSINTRALRIAEIIAIPETVRDYQILLGLLEGICGLPPAEPMLNPSHEMGHQLGAEIYADLAGRPSTMASAIRHDLQVQRDDAWRELAAMRQERDWLRSVTEDLVRGKSETDIVTVPRRLLVQSLEALRCSEPYIGCGLDHTDKRAKAINELEHAIRTSIPGNGGGEP